MSRYAGCTRHTAAEPALPNHPFMPHSCTHAAQPAQIFFAPRPAPIVATRAAEGGFYGLEQLGAGKTAGVF